MLLRNILHVPTTDVDKLVSVLYFMSTESHVLLVLYYRHGIDELLL